LSSRLTFYNAFVDMRKVDTARRSEDAVEP
jgi:hypothetical protein